jgi:ATP/ADP translocase
MSLYENKTTFTNFGVVPNTSQRPFLVQIGLIVATAFTLISLVVGIFEYREILKFEFKDNAVDQKILIELLISVSVVVASIIHLLKSINIIGWLIAAIWTIKIIENFAGAQLIGLIVLGVTETHEFGTTLNYYGGFGDWQAVIVSVLMTGIYISSTLKYESSDKMEEHLK